MFGYVTVNPTRLKEGEDAIYHSYYCGLCHALYKQGGIKSQALLTYDMTFLVILLNGLYEDEMQEKNSPCLMHPMKTHHKQFNKWSDYAADMNILLAYYNLLDDWQDDRKITRYAAASLLKRKVNKIAKAYPRQTEAVKTYIRDLSACEKSGSEDIEAAAVMTGRMLGEVFVAQKDMWSRDLYQMGFFLGKFIYYMDAYEDVEKDIESGSYNPLKQLFTQPDFDENCKQIQMMQMSECCRAFERLPIVSDVGLLRNILYSGVWCKFAVIYNKRYDINEKDKGTTS